MTVSDLIKELMEVATQDTRVIIVTENDEGIPDWHDIVGLRWSFVDDDDVVMELAW